MTTSMTMFNSELLNTLPTTARKRLVTLASTLLQRYGAIEDLTPEDKRNWALELLRAIPQDDTLAPHFDSIVGEMQSRGRKVLTVDNSRSNRIGTNWVGLNN